MSYYHKEEPMVGGGGDDALFLGLMAAVEPSYQPLLDQCLGFDDYYLYRNPVFAKEQKQYYNCSSRDMLAGLLFLNNKKVLQAFVDATRKRGGKLAEEGDDRIHMRLSGWGQFHMMGIKCGWRGLLGSLFVRPISVIEAATAWKGYQVHLVLVKLLWLKLVVKKWGWWERMTCKILKERIPHDAFLACLLGDYDKAKEELASISNTREFNIAYKERHWVFGHGPRHIHYYCASVFCALFISSLIKRLKDGDSRLK